MFNRIKTRSLRKIRYERIRDFCISEKLDEAYMMSLIGRDFHKEIDLSKIKHFNPKKVL